MSFLDADGDGYVTRRDFKIMARAMGLGPVGEIAASLAFNKFDKDHNGVLDPYEIYRAFGPERSYPNRYAIDYYPDRYHDRYYDRYDYPDRYYDYPARYSPRYF